MLYLYTNEIKLAQRKTYIDISQISCKETEGILQVFE